MTTTNNTTATETETLSAQTESLRAAAARLLVIARVADEDAVTQWAIGDEHPLQVARKIAWKAYNDMQALATASMMRDFSGAK
jgi:hypothetical protein